MHNEHKQLKKIYKMILCLCLSIVLACSSIMPLLKNTYNVNAEENSLEMQETTIEDDMEVESEQKKETTEATTSENTSESDTMPNDNSETESNDNKEDIETQPIPDINKSSKVLQMDNSSQRKEQEEQKKEISTAVSVELAAQTEFPEGSVGKISVLEGEELENLKQSLNIYLGKEKKEISKINLPLEIGFTNAQGESQEKKETVVIKLSMEDEKEYEELKTLNEEGKLSLYHRKKSDNGEDTWEKLELQMHDKTEGERAYIEFTTERFSPFLFTQTTDKKDTVIKKKRSASRNVNPNQSLSIGRCKVTFLEGAETNGGKLVWQPTSTNPGHMFTYNLDYKISGTTFKEQGDLKFELPLHILKDREGNWADTFECPYLLKSELSEDEETDFVYEIDEENNKVIISNYEEMTAAQTGYLEFSYTTTKSTTEYKDMEASDKVSVNIYAKAENENVITKKVDGNPVYINTYARISETLVQQPSYYTEWQDSWGAKPSDSDFYYYLVWPIRSVISNTAPYNIRMEDQCSDLEGSVVGYRFSGESSFSESNEAENLRNSGSRYDYVLTRYRKAKAEEILQNSKGYNIANRIKTIVVSADLKDSSTDASSSKTWYYEKPRYTSPTGYFWSEKSGIFGSNSIVRDSEDISDYSLNEFKKGEESTIENLRFYTYIKGYTGSYSLEDGVIGSQETAENGSYWKKKVGYELTDETFSLEEVNQTLTEEDYDITAINWSADMSAAVYNPEELRFTATKINDWKAEDAISIWVCTSQRESADKWKKVAVYDKGTKTYTMKDDTVITSAWGQDISFTEGIKGVRLTCENAYYYTKLNLTPSVSLKRTDHVLGLIGEQTKVRLINQSAGCVTQDNHNIFEKTQQATDYIQQIEPSSTIKKDVIQTKNDKRKKKYYITWRANVKEEYLDNGGKHYVRQNSGTFYDLIPAGAGVDKSSITVKTGDKVLDSGLYTVKLKANYQNSGRTLVTIQINEATNAEYLISYQTAHSYEAIQDYGKSIYNSVAYETGNDKIAGGFPDDGGKIRDKDIMKDLDKDTDAEKFLYAGSWAYINILMAGNNGLKKQVKSEKDTLYTSETSVKQGESYSYQIRVANDNSTKCKNVVFFDSLENYRKNNIDSDWRGTLTGIDLSALNKLDIQPVVYLSQIEELDINSHHNLNEKINGESVWLEYSRFTEKYGLQKAHAIAVDVSKKIDGTNFTMGGKQSMVFTIYMKAPETEPSDKTDPIAYNNIYLKRDVLEDEDGENGEQDQLIHQECTKLHYRVTGDVSLKKVDQTDGISPVSEATYLLRGTSDYGTVYSESRMTDKNGNFLFEGIEKGSYELLESDCTADWLLDTEVYAVTVDNKGKVSVQGLTTNDEGQYVVKDKPRIHGNLNFKKVDMVTENPINDVEFVLIGTSDYGNDIFKHAVSEGVDAGNYETGDVSIENLEMGTYQLTETKTKDGYIISQDSWNVNVDDRGIVSLLDKNGSEVEKNTKGTYMVKNEPLHSIRFVKSSTYGDNIYLAGAEFVLTGVSDYGTNTNKIGMSGQDGIVTIKGLEPGTYQLKETKAPDEHELNTTIYTVIVKSDGTYTIEGLNKTTIGSAQIYDFKNVKTTGVIKVTKVWQDSKSNAERVVPDISISTRKPSKNPKGYSIVFDANGGTFVNKKTTNEIAYSEQGTPVDGVYQNPTPDEEGATFLGWYTEKTGGEKIEISTDGELATPVTEDITLYAQYKSAVKYAVAIYGIEVDDVKNGETGATEKGGLTFGPALGGDYVSSYKNHEATGQTASGNPHRCVHDDTWTEIIEWNKKDPYVYEDCIAEGCTHSVILKKNTTSTIFNEESIGSKGDGKNSLYNELMPIDNCYENLRWNTINYGSGSMGVNAGGNTGGWGKSRIRAMLNGADEVTATSPSYWGYCSDAKGDINKSASIYTSTNCLLATFPEELQNAIGERAVKYNPNYYNTNYLLTTYDKLWLLSPNEIADTVNDTNLAHPLEGECYTKFVGTGDLSEACEKRRYNATVHAQLWLRSTEVWTKDQGIAVVSLKKDGHADRSMGGNGTATGNFPYPFAAGDIAPGFTLER